LLVTGDTVDTFHQWDASDPSWTETTWFGAWVPEAATSVYVYHWFRPAIGIYGGGCFVWDAEAHLPWDIPAFYYDVNLPIRGSLDLSALELPGGTCIHTVAPGQRYDIRYARNDVELAMQFTALTPADVSSAHGMQEFFAGHVDQAGRYRGTLKVAGREHTIDCCGIRDRSWGPRVITESIRMNYCHGQGERLAFVSYSTPDGANDRVFRGYLALDGRRCDLQGGHRRAHYRNGELESIDIEVIDADGRRRSGSGVPLNKLVYMPYPNLLTWLYLMKWQIGDEIVYGEEQDVWSVPLWRGRDRQARQ
jgi:hypothetical protein